MMFQGFFQGEEGSTTWDWIVLAGAVAALLLVIFGHTGDEAVKVPYPTE